VSVERISVDAGIAVDPDELDAAAARLAVLAAELGNRGLQVLALSTEPAFVLSAAVAPTTAAGVVQAAGELVLGRRSPAVVAAALGALAVEVETAALRYRVGDEVADAVVALARRAVAEAVVEFAPEIAVGALAVVAVDAAVHTTLATQRVIAAAYDQYTEAGSVDLDEVAQDAAEEFGGIDDAMLADARTLGSFLAAHPELSQEVVATTPYVIDAARDRHPVLGAVLEPTDGDVAAAAGAFTSLGAVSPLFRETGVTVRAAEQPRATPARAPRGIAEVLDGVAHQSTGHRPGNSSEGDRLAPAGTPPPGAVRIEKVTHAEGRTGWIVEIPGTQDWTPVPAEGGTPMDLTTNLRAVAGQSTVTAAAVVQALRAAGVDPADPVMLAGHSQGGLTAAALAADPAVRAEFSITHVVTAGSPVDGFEIPPQVRVLSLEHTGDVVPALDGETAAGGGNRIVVARDAGESEPLAAHASSAYIETARRVDESEDAALQAFRSSGSVFFDAPGTSVEAFDHYAERDSRPAPAVAFRVEPQRST